jgi:hypothetical protein
MQIHLVIVQPDRYVHSLGFLDTADYLQYWLQQQGLQVTVAKNRLRYDAVNLVFGAHLGFDPQWLDTSFCTFFFNLEQIGRGGAVVSAEYQALLRTGPVIDYHPANVAAYRDDAGSVPLVPFLNAPYLNPDEPAVPLSERPIDLLFFGSINAERKAFIQRIEKTGLDVAVFDAPTYYQERDAYVRQAKAVINTSFYASARFEQVRAFNVLSLGTAFISYLQSGQKVDEDFRDPVFWVNEQNFDLFFKQQFGKEEWCLAAQQKFDRWRQTSPCHSMSHLIQVLKEHWQRHQESEQATHHVRRLMQAEDGSYFQDAVNLSLNQLDQADLEIDLCEKQNWPWEGVGRWGQKLQIGRRQVELMILRRWPETSQQWRALLANAMALLSPEGELRIETLTEGFDFTSDKSADLKKAEMIWLEFSSQFWKAGLFDERVSSIEVKFANDKNQIVDKKIASKISFIFKKTETTLIERTFARMQSPYFGNQKFIQA